MSTASFAPAMMGRAITQTHLLPAIQRTLPETSGAALEPGTPGIGTQPMAWIIFKMSSRPILKRPGSRADFNLGSQERGMARKFFSFLDNKPIRLYTDRRCYIRGTATEIKIGHRRGRYCGIVQARTRPGIGNNRSTPYVFH